MKQSTIEIPPWGWITFGFVVVILLAIDHLAHRGAREIALTVGEKRA
jgi:hypothetical protein